VRLAQRVVFLTQCSMVGAKDRTATVFSVKMFTVYYRVLTLILLTWRIGRVPNNASKLQMGFNSEFKELSS